MNNPARLDALFTPSSVALIGASNKLGTLGHDLVDMLSSGGYTGSVYPVTPRNSEVCELACYPALEAIGRPVDLAVLGVNAKRVKEQAETALASGAGALAVFANCVLEEEDGAACKLEDRLAYLRAGRKPEAATGLLEEYGALRGRSLAELANTLFLFATFPSAPAGDPVCVADSCGERMIMLDVVEKLGLAFAELSLGSTAKLVGIQEYGQPAVNPLDPWETGLDLERIFEESLLNMLADDNAAIGIISQDLRNGYFLSESCVAALAGVLQKHSNPVLFMIDFNGVRRAELTVRVATLSSYVLTETRDALAAVRHWLTFRDFKLPEARRGRP